MRLIRKPQDPFFGTKKKEEKLLLKLFSEELFFYRDRNTCSERKVFLLKKSHAVFILGGEDLARGNIKLSACFKNTESS